MPGDSSADSYSARMIYDLLRPADPVVTWHKEVLFTRGIPKHMFMTWLFVLDKCPTKERMVSWGLAVDPTCVLYNAAPELRDHLFFNCSYSREIWESITSGSPISPSLNWIDVLTALQLPSLSGPWRLLSLLTW